MPLQRLSGSGSETTSKSDDSRLQQNLAFKLAQTQLAKRKPVPQITDSRGNAASSKSLAAHTPNKKACNHRSRQRHLTALHLEERCGELNGLVCRYQNYSSRLQPYASYFPIERAHDAAVGYLLRVYERAVSRPQ